MQDQAESLISARSQFVNLLLASGQAGLNVGCGTKFDSGFVNTDLYPETGADFLFDCESEIWPFEDSTFNHVVVSHVLEHLGNGIEHFFKELYRTAKNGAIIEINVPHPRHNWFLQDPTHKHPWIPESFDHFDMDKCKQWYFNGDTKTPLALYWHIDFKVAGIEQIIHNNEVSNHIASTFHLRTNNYADLVPYLNNTIGEIRVKLQCRK